MSDDDERRPEQEAAPKSFGGDKPSLLVFDACPDCAARPQSNVVRHLPTCPHNGAMDRVLDRDRDYFLRHPGVTQYRRPATWAEQVEQRLVTGQRAVAVLVIQLKPGLRARYFTYGGEVR